MRKSKPNTKALDPVANLMIAAQQAGWCVIAPVVDKKRDLCFGLIVGEDKWVDLVRSFLPDDFDKRVEKVLNLPPIIEEATIVEAKVEEPKNE